MSIDLQAAASFMATHARLLDRRRFALLVAAGDPGADRAAVLEALDGYRNRDGGYGWGLEPDLRAAGSQPAAALHAFEAMADAASATMDAAAADTAPGARDLVDHLGRFVPPDGAVRVEGGAEGETLHLLDVTPHPGRPVRSLLTDEAVTADLDRLAGQQQPDGGWPVDFDSYSPAAALEWRGYATVSAVAILRRNGR